jgi:hypothetical protein
MFVFGTETIKTVLSVTLASLAITRCLFCFAILKLEPIMDPNLVVLYTCDNVSACACPFHLKLNS